MSRCELRKHFQGFQIQGCGLFNKALFPLDIGQVIKGVSMVWTQPRQQKRMCQELIKTPSNCLTDFDTHSQQFCTENGGAKNLTKSRPKIPKNELNFG